MPDQSSPASRTSAGSVHPAAPSAGLIAQQLQLSDSPHRRALLLFALGRQRLAQGDADGAASAFRDATLEQGDFAEALEAWWLLASARGLASERDDALARLLAAHAESPRLDELLVALAATDAYEGRNASEALEQLTLAGDRCPDDARLGPALELTATLADDADARCFAIARRAECCDDTERRSVLLVELAQRLLDAGQPKTARQTAERVGELGRFCGFPAQQILEQIACRTGDSMAVGRALDAQARMSLVSANDAEFATRQEVPPNRRSAAAALDSWLRAADYALRGDDATQSSAWLDEAPPPSATDAVGLRARLEIAERSGDSERTAELARALLELGADPRSAASLWLRVAEQAADRGDAAGALDAVSHAVECDPSSLPARALKLDLLAADRGAAQALATALEETADQLTTDEAKARCFLLAAESWALGARDIAGAKAALSQCVALGSDPEMTSRVSRWLAGHCDDPAWYEESLRRLLASGSDPEESRSLSFELLRQRLLRRSATSTLETLTRLEQDEATRPLAALVAAWIVPLLDAEAPSEERSVIGERGRAHLSWLASSDGPQALQHALRLALVLRSFSERSRDEALEQLELLWNDAPQDDLVAGLYVFALLAQQRPDRASEVLFACANGQSSERVAASMYWQALGLVLRSGNLGRIDALLERLRGLSPTLTESLEPWLLRAGSRQLPELMERARALGSEGVDAGWCAMESFAFAIFAPHSTGDPEHLLTRAAEATPDELACATLLVRASRGDSETALVRADEALAALGELAPSQSQALAAARHALSLRPSAEPAQRVARARDWAGIEPSVLPCLEWAAAAIAAGDFAEEQLAQEALAARLPLDQGDVFRTQLALFRRVASGSSQPELSPPDPSAPPSGDAPVLASLELAPPGGGLRRAVALSAAAETFGTADGPVVHSLVGFNALAAGEPERAIEAFALALGRQPDDPASWLGQKLAAEQVGNLELLARSCEGLGRSLSDRAEAASSHEQAAALYLGELADEAAGERALAAAVDLDIGRRRAFEELFRRVRLRKQSARVVELAERRLEVSDDLDELIKLHWERARALRDLGDRSSALAALGNVTLLCPDHVGALALAGEMNIREEHYEEAVTALCRLAELGQVPDRQRLMSGVAAVDVLESRLEAPDRALDVLERLHAGCLSTPALRERIAKLAARLGRWSLAASVLEELMSEREARESRIEAARLALAIHRDERAAPADALAATRTLLREAPDDAEAIDFLLSRPFGDDVSQALMSQARFALMQALETDPLDAERVDRLARVALELHDWPLRQATLGALVSLGEGSPPVDEELAALDQRVQARPQVALDLAAMPELLAPDDHGSIAELMRRLAPGFVQAVGPSLQSYGVSKKQRVSPQMGTALRHEVAAWAGALALDDFELYVTEDNPELIRGVPSDPPAVIIGSSVPVPLTTNHRQRLARELFAITRGSSLLGERSATDVAALVTAACRVGEHPIVGPDYALLGEFERQLKRSLPRKYRKQLPELSGAIAEQGADPLAWFAAAQSSLDRVALVAAGDPSWVLAQDARVRGRPGLTLESQRRAQRLLSFAFSGSYLALRDRLGMGVK